MAAKPSPFQKAVTRGRAARRLGKPLSSCPYRDKVNGGGGATFSRSWILHWESGWRAQDKELAAQEAE